MNEERWRRLVAVVLVLVVLVVGFIFRRRIGADFWPLDSSRIGPNLVASAVEATIVTCVVLYSPVRRRMHAFIDHRLRGLHDRLDTLEEHHNRHIERFEGVLAKLEEIGETLGELHDDHTRRLPEGD